MVGTQLKLIGLSALLAAYGAFATYQWISNNAIAPLECDNSTLTTRIAELEASNAGYVQELLDAYTMGAKQPVLGNQAKVEVRTVFVPIKEKVDEVPAPTGCTGAFPERVLDGAREALAAAKAAGGVPAAGD